MIDPTALYNKAIEQAEDWADKEHAAGVLEDAVGAMEGLLYAEYKAKGEPATLIPRLIKKDDRHKNALNLWRDAKKEAHIAKMKYDQVNKYQDNIRTKESTERQLAR